MANRGATGAMNFSSASWQTCDTTMLKTNGTVSTAVTTSYLNSAAYTPGIITVDGVYLNIFSVTSSPTGTMTVSLYNSTGSIEVTNTVVNVADLPPGGVNMPANTGPWVFIKWGASQTLLAATNYLIRVMTSSSNQVNLYAGASNDWNQVNRTTTTGSMAAGDVLFVSKELTGAGTSNAVTVTGDNNSTTAWGQCNITQATWTVATGANTQHRFSGHFLCWQATINCGTSGGRILNGTTAIMEINCSSIGQYSFYFGPGCTGNVWGQDKTKRWSKLAADAAASATSLTIADNVGATWKNGDSILLTSTSTTTTQYETKALTADSNNTTLTIAAITNAHGGGGTAGVVAEICNLTSNVKWQGVSSTYTAGFMCDVSANVTFRDVEFTNLYDGIYSGIAVQTTSAGAFDMENCSIHDMTVSGTRGINFDPNQQTNVSNITCKNNVIYNCYTGGIMVGTMISGTIDNNVVCRNNSGSNRGVFIIYGASAGYGAINTITNNYVSGNQATGFGGFMLVGSPATSSGNVAHSNTGYGLYCPMGFISFNNQVNTYGSFTSWRNTISGGFIDPTNGPTNTTWVFNTLTTFGNGTSGWLNGVTGIFKDMSLTIDSWTDNAGTTQTQAIGLDLASNSFLSNIRITNSTFGATTTHATGDVRVGAICPGIIDVLFENCTFSSSTTISGQINIYLESINGVRNCIRSARHGQVAGAYKSFFKNGSIINDTSVTHISTVSEKMIPIAGQGAGTKLVSATKIVETRSGNAVTVGVWINKNASYNGDQPRLIVKKNVAAGITSDMVLATYASGTGSWNQISGTTVAVTENCVLEFFVDCNGTAGYINVSDWTQTGA